VNNTSQPNIRLLLIDDHALFRAGLARLLEHEPDLTIVSHCGSVAEAISVLDENQVDVVLLDYDLGTQRGPDFLRLAAERKFSVRTLVVTGRASTMEARQLIEQGVSGIFFKHEPPTLLPQAIREVASGRTWLDQNLFRDVIRRDSSFDSSNRSKALTEREKQILRYIVEGQSNKEISSVLSTSVTSVKSTLQQLFNKTGVRSRGQLVRIAMEDFRDQL
jgi:two-component system, NarL family, nitrate/nitrite response regulator NarL